jgi:hypothetical protein
MTVALWCAALVVAALTVHTGRNARLLRRPGPPESTVDIRVDVLLPVRNEAHRVGECLRSVLAQRGVPGLRVIVLDDGSTDATAALVLAHGDPRLRLVTGAALPTGWLGKPYACQQLADHSDAPVLVFVDADVVLAPQAIAAAVELLAGFDLVSPYPRLLAQTAGERLIQPLLPWSWLTFLPVRAMERSPRPSLAAAGGQFLVVRRSGYDRAGGHAAVRSRVVEDVALARAIKRTGGRIAIADGSRLAACRMYTSWAQLRDGYSKSLWAAFGPPVAAVGIAALLLGLYALVPLLGVVGALTGRWAWFWPGLCGYGLGGLGRLVTARATGGRRWPDAWTHPVSVALFAWLVGRSLLGRARGTLRWKGRPVVARP